MEDDYFHIEDGLFYIVESILGPLESSDDYNKLAMDFNSTLLNNCNCDICSHNPPCNCLQNSGGYDYISKDTDESLPQSTNDKKDILYPIFECNDYCACGDQCVNRIVQKGPNKNLSIKMCSTQSKGYGLFSSSFICKGTFICEYAGEIITKSEANMRHEANKQYGKMNYIFCLNEFCKNGILQFFVDPSIFGNIGRYINHSCEPNCKIIPVRYQTPIPKLAIFSCVDIPPDTEITFSYGLNDPKSLMSSESRIKCLCNTSQCTGVMPYDMYLQ